jgi:hypothetical protein
MKDRWLNFGFLHQILLVVLSNYLAPLNRDFQNQGVALEYVLSFIVLQKQN